MFLLCLDISKTTKAEIFYAIVILWMVYHFINFYNIDTLPKGADEREGRSFLS